MIISNFGNNFNYELEKLSRLFLPFEKITVVNDFQQNENRYAVTKTEFNDNGCFISAFLSLDGKDANEDCFFEKTGTDFIKECELCLARLLFNCFVKLTEYKPAFGILTGVRPTRLFLSTADKLGSIDNSCDYFKSVLLVDDKKINLLKQTAVSEESIIKKSDLNSYSLYLSIPFCPSRCSYCSFVSHSVEKAQYLIDDYIDYLIKELHETSLIAENLGLKLETVYIGGGTPTILSPVQLDKLLSALNKYFLLSNVREFTVEAGRPDTVTKEKLAVLKEYGVTRISINPQTLNDNVLINIGRKHTKEDFYNAFNLAQKMSFDNINTDLIAGLPTDTFESFKNTINEIVAISPQSVTVHSLSMKRASTLTATGFSPEIDMGIIADKMVDYAYNTLTNNMILPYYMYRQSKTVGNLENVGYAKKGFEGLYNVYIMDETHTILACGASGSTKLKNQKTGKIKRIFNYKYPYEYINRFSEQLNRKNEIVTFYGEM